jgi:hypothetical protein
MNCSSCGTRVPANQKNCPNCGRNQATQPRPQSGGENSSSGSSSRPLSASSAKAPSRRDGLRDASGRKPDRPAKKKKAARRSPEVSLEESVDESMDSQTDFEAGSPQIRALVHDRPDCLEDGLSIYTDADAEPVGLDFPTDVGSVDLLARDDAGGLVVVLIAPDSSEAEPLDGKDLVSQALERVGWVHKHVAEPKQEVRAIVLLEHLPDDLSYTAAAVSSTVSFKTYRLEINFSDVEV